MRSYMEQFYNLLYNIKQLLDKVFCDIQSYEGRGKCY